MTASQFRWPSISRQGTVFLLALAVAIVAVAGFVAWTSLRIGGDTVTIAVDDIGEAVAALVGAACCGVAARRASGRPRVGWWLLAASAATWGAGEIVWSVYQVGLGVPVPFPSAADVGFLGAIPLAAAGILMFVFSSPGSSSTRLRLWLDAGIVCLALVSVSWTLGLRTLYNFAGDPPLVRIIGLAYPVSDILIGIILVLAIQRATVDARGRLLLLLGGLASNAVADSAFAYMNAAGTYGAIGSVLDAGWVIGFLMIGLAALWPMKAVAPVIQLKAELEQPPDIWQVVLPWVAILAAGLNAILLPATGHALDAFLIILAGGIAVLVMASSIHGHTESLNLLIKSRLYASRLNDIIRYAPLGVVRIGSDMQIIQANPRFMTVLRRPEAEVVGAPLSTILPPLEMVRATEQFRALSEGSMAATDSEFEAVRTDGEALWLHWTATEVRDANGEVDYFIAMFWDTTDRHEAEVAAFSNLGVLERLDRLKREFLRMVSHEFRTSLVGIQGFSELIRDTEDLDPAQAKAFASDIYNDAQRLDQMLRRVLDKDRVEADAMVMKFAPVDIGEAVREAVARVRASDRAHLFAVDLDSDLGLVSGDAVRLATVMNILLSNAIKYSPKSSKVTVSARRQVDEDVVSVSDHGMGMPADFDDRLFGPHRWNASDTNSGVMGSGIGLPMARQIVEMHGGRIWFETTKGQGSVFHFSVPLQAVHAVTSERRSEVPAAARV
ncbi:MAG: ATP-binding protein [Candidatus Dormiibacterota bacterium]